MPHVLELQSEEEVCDVMERAINKYCSIFYGGFSSSFIQMSLIHLTETVKELIKHYEHECKEGKSDSHIWDIKLEAFKQGIITEYKGNNTSF